MRHEMRAALVAAMIALPGLASAQATGMPSFNAPYRAFSNSEMGLLIEFPGGSGTAFEGAYRYASGSFDIGLRGGLFAPGQGSNAVLLAGVEGRERVLTHSAGFPLDGALILGIGGQFVSGASALIVPVGLSLGRRLDVQNSAVSIVPYVLPTAFLVAGNGGSDVQFALGLGGDFRLSRRFDARLSVGFGDIDGVSFGAVWVH